jgi:hypothetical protein
MKINRQQRISMYRRTNTTRIRALAVLGLAIGLACIATTAGADQRSGAERREDARTCARLGTIGAGTVTCMQLLPRVISERGNAAPSNQRSAQQRREDARTCARLGTIGAGTVTCMQLLPRALEERERTRYFHD